MRGVYKNDKRHTRNGMSESMPPFTQQCCRFNVNLRTTATASPTPPPSRKILVSAIYFLLRVRLCGCGFRILAHYKCAHQRVRVWLHARMPVLVCLGVRSYLRQRRGARRTAFIRNTSLSFAERGTSAHTHDDDVYVYKYNIIYRFNQKCYRTKVNWITYERLYSVRDCECYWIEVSSWWKTCVISCARCQMMYL